MEIKKETVFHGPNFLLPVPTIALLLGRAAGFAGLTEQRLCRLVDHINGAIQSTGATAELGTVDRELLQRAPSLAVGELVARTASALQKEYHYPAERARALVQPEAEHVLVAYEFGDLGLGLLAGRDAVVIWAAALGNPESPPEALKNLYGAFKKRADAVAPTLETRLLLQEAGRRNIPWFRLGDNTPIFQLGQGAKQKRFHNSLSDETSDMAYRLASIKPVAARLLRQHGIPVPAQATTETLEQALAAARRIGFPVVIKPINQDRGIGVRVGIGNEAELSEAFPATRAFGTVQVEKYLQGFDYRFTFMRGSLAGVLCTMPPIIVGDGKASIRQLLDAAPVTTPTFARKKVIVDEEVLRRIAGRGHTLADVLPVGEQIVLRQWWRNQPDHMLENVTVATHPDNIEAAALAVQLVGLDIAGVDFITTDISRPYYETGGAFTEVNPMPALAGVQRSGIPAYRLLLEAFFPPGDDGRIPIAVLLDAGDVAPTLAAAELLLDHSGYCIGVGTLSRFEVGGKPVRRADADEGSRIRTVAADPRATMAIVQATPDTIGCEGLAIDQCDVGVIMSDEQGPHEVDASLDNPGSQAAALIVAISRKVIVLGVDDPRSTILAASAVGKRIIWVMSDLDGTLGSGRFRPNDAVVAIGSTDSGYFITISDDRGVERITPAPEQLLGNQAIDRQARRASLTAIAIACGFGLSSVKIAAAVAAHGSIRAKTESGSESDGSATALGLIL
ncbi:MAG: acetate--CoA ligase family protein [Rhodospirillales bacterium]